MTTEQALATLAEYIDPKATVAEVRELSLPYATFIKNARDKEAWAALRVLAGAK